VTEIVNGSIADPYQSFIHKSRYARWIESENRRENWEETVDRYINFMRSEVGWAYSESEFLEVRQNILELKVLPSMRALMTAGKALQRDHIAGYNCAFIGVDSFRSFDEAAYILLNGTGVGFSVEKQFMQKLPEIAEDFYDTETTIVVHDSKLGWAKAYKELIALLSQGQIPSWDTSLVRPAGARLKTFGGRASGPIPLIELFEFTIDIFKNAAGRKLKSIEAHDIMCKIGDVVVVGGVRRAALISFSDLDDYEMAKAKSGQWWEDNPQRALANNTAVYKGLPNVAQFLREWRNLYESKSGERGMTSVDAMKSHFNKFERRDWNENIRSNPCLSYDTKLLTSEGLQEIGELADSGGIFDIYNGKGEFVPSIAWETGVKKVYTVSFSNGLSIDLTDNHIIEVMAKKSGSYKISAEVAVKDLEVGMRVLPMVAQRAWPEGTSVELNQALAAGLFFAAGREGSAGEVDEKSVFIKTNELEVIDFLSEHYRDIFYFTGKTCVVVTEDFLNLGVELSPFDFGLPKSVFTWKEESVRAFLKGLYSISGLVYYQNDRIMLRTTGKKLVEEVQILLSALGFSSYIITNRPTDTEWANGTFKSKESYDLSISGSLQYRKFQKEIGFLNHRKSVDCVGTSEVYNIKTVLVTSVEYKDIEPVYDFKEEVTHWGWANGLKVHNCHEIFLNSNQFCNLTEVVVAPEDDEESIKEKIRIATIMGTWQSTLTDFKYLRKIWKDNTEKERLLGVSMTGIFGNPMLYTVSDKTKDLLSSLRDFAVKVNEEHSLRLKINPSAAVTCVKPSGTTSQLSMTSSGIHPWYSKFYIRRVRGDNKDPLTSMLKDFGIPWEPESLHPENTCVFSFPVAAPKDAVVQKDLSAIEHLEIWKMFRDNWTEHNPSVTISIKEDEWLSVGSWVFENFNSIGGVSFLPSSNHTYKQAPYEEISELEYFGMLDKMPETIPWESLPLYENSDGTTGSQELACSASGCDII
jgi:ribonucleotide reductase alpha subunit